MKGYDATLRRLAESPRTWLVTGVAGFVGFHLAERLLSLGQRVRGVDNFAAGQAENVRHLARAAEQRSDGARFEFVLGDIKDGDLCENLVCGVDFVMHQAAVTTGRRASEEPLSSHAANVDGFAQLLDASRRASVQRVVYASCSSVYGDDPASLKEEEQIGAPLSTYAATKRINELYADVFHRSYGLEIIGLRYFNVFGPRQLTRGAFPAIVPRWTEMLCGSEPCYVSGNPNVARDFCFVDDVVQANLLAAMAQSDGARAGIYNVGSGSALPLSELFELLRQRVARRLPSATFAQLEVRGDRDAEGEPETVVPCLKKICASLGYAPRCSLGDALDVTVDWYVERHLANLGDGVSRGHSTTPCKSQAA